MSVLADQDAPISLADGSMYLGDVEPIYDRLLTQSPVYWYDEHRVWVVSKWADVRDVLRDHETFSSEKGSHFFPFDDRTAEGRAPSANVLYMDPPKHTHYRKLIMKALTPPLVKAVEPRIRMLVNRQLDGYDSGSIVDFVQTMSVPIPLLVITEMLGLPSEDHALYLKWADAFGSSHVAGTDPADRQRTIAQMTEYMDTVLKQRLKAPGEDLLSTLAFASEEGEHLEHGEVLQIAILMLAAGNDTTRQLLSGGVRALLRFPEERARLVADPSLIPNAVEEMLRYVSPVRYFGRVATRDTEVRGQAIKAGEAVIAYFAAANRDPEVYADPHRFDVTRRMESTPHVAFSYGVHFCAGARLARREAIIAFEELLRRFPDFELAGEVELEPNVILNATHSLPICPV